MPLTVIWSANKGMALQRSTAKTSTHRYRSMKPLSLVGGESLESFNRNALLSEWGRAPMSLQNQGQSFGKQLLSTERFELAGLFRGGQKGQNITQERKPGALLNMEGRSTAPSRAADQSQSREACPSAKPHRARPGNTTTLHSYRDRSPRPRQ